MKLNDTDSPAKHFWVIVCGIGGNGRVDEGEDGTKKEFAKLNKATKIFHRQQIHAKTR